MTEKRQFRNLALKGGGVRGIAYTGAAQVLEDTGIMPDIRNVAGTSAGAIMALLISLGYKSDELQAIMFEKNFRDFQDKHYIGEFNKKYGWHSGVNFLRWVKGFIREKLGRDSATFADLRKAALADKANFKKLTVFATDLNLQEAVAFSCNTDDEKILNTPIAEAVRASMSIPLFFDAWRFPGRYPNKHIFVDGGAMYNYPLTYFDADEEGEDERYQPYESLAKYKFDEKTMGLYLTDATSKKTYSSLSYGGLLKVRNFIEYSKNLTSALLDAQDLELMRHPSDVSRTVFIESFGISATNFDITAQCKCALINSGIKSTVERLVEWGVIDSDYKIPKAHYAACAEATDFDPAKKCV